MAGNLVIVESPAKAGTIQKYLGSDYIVKPSFGHIRDLQEKNLSVDVEKGFAPVYVIPADKKKVVAELKKLASKATTVWLASDEDREGEAISWHLFDALGLKQENTKRIVFHEITKNAILKAIENPRSIDMNLVDAQQARRVLDRLVGFELSPVLWHKIQPKLSAGRVQSVALRLVVEREKEIIAFNREPYYRIEGEFQPAGSKVKIKAVLENRFATLEEARRFLEDSIGAEYNVASVESKDARRSPAAPFTTSTLQQEASRRLHFPVARTMQVAQSLYEKGLITYMRTDSTNLSSLALADAKKFIFDNFGEEYSHVRQYKTHSKGAQEAHEAIRPTYISQTSISGTPQEQKLYNLIWKRTVASQMADAKVKNTNIKIAISKRSEKYAAQATEIVFDGFYKLDSQYDEDEGDNEAMLPALNVGTALKGICVNAECRYTAPAPRYSEATLVKKLEELGIGRPSTYAPTISTLTKTRGYIVKGDKEGFVKEVTDLSLKKDIINENHKQITIGAEKGKLLPQDIGIIVTDYLTENFPDIVDYSFTANIEKEFDEIAEGTKVWNSAISDFYSSFHPQVASVISEGARSHVEREIGTDPTTGATLTAKFGKYGPYVQYSEGENVKYANLPEGELIDTISLEAALKLFELPRNVGTIGGVSVTATTGRYGPYIKYGTLNVSLPKGCDPLTVTLEECMDLVRKKQEASSASKTPLREFAGGMAIYRGPYGEYLKFEGKNYRIPKGRKIEDLTEEDCKTIISKSKK